VKRTDVEKLATEVAAELGKIRGESWALAELVPEEDEYPWAVLQGPGNARVRLIVNWYSPGRLTAVGLYPEGTHGQEIKASTNPAFAPARIARTVDRRVLAAGYTDCLVPALAERAWKDKKAARIGLLLRRAAELFGDAPADAQRVYLGSRLLGSGTVEVHSNNWPGNGEPDGYTLNLAGIPEETALAMLAVLAARTVPRAECCKDYPGHPERQARPGCETYGDRPPAQPFTRGQEPLYDEYLANGEWQQTDFGSWLSARLT